MSTPPMPPTDAAAAPAPLVTAVGMGYGHLRAAQALADHLGVEVVRPDLEGPEARRWQRTRSAYEGFTRLTGLPWLGRPFRRLLEAATDIPPPSPPRDLSRPNLATRVLARLIRRGLGRDLTERALAENRIVVSTFYAQAIAAAAHGAERAACVVTDSDVNRIWAPLDSRSARVTYLAPSRRVLHRLQAYGVPASRIVVTGFPLPPELLGGPGLPTLRRHLAARLVRLDPSGGFAAGAGREVTAALGEPPEHERGRPPLLTLAVGGAGAQADLARDLLYGLAEPLRRGELRLALVAGVRREVARGFQRAVAEAGLADAPPGALEVLYEPEFTAYYRRFNRLLADTDALWTKPSEMVFYAALGLPLVLAPPVGRHEAYNARWVTDRGAAIDQRRPRAASSWLREWLDEGVLAAAAWAGFCHLPSDGTYRIGDVLTSL